MSQGQKTRLPNTGQTYRNLRLTTPNLAIGASMLAYGIDQERFLHAYSKKVRSFRRDGICQYLRLGLLLVKPTE